MSTVVGAQPAPIERTGPLSWREWAHLVGDESAPFGDRVDCLYWRPKDVHLVARDHDGRAVAAVGAGLVTVLVGEHRRFQVVGIGSLIVRPRDRSSGLGLRLIDAMALLAPTLGPERAMCFCEPRLVRLYRRWGYEPIAASVWAHQPHGEILMEHAALWKALRPGVQWPAGEVHIDGLPF